MPKFKRFLLAGLFVLVPMLAFAADGDVAQAPEWLGAILTFVAGVPYVGPVIVEVMKWLGVIASVMTALSLGVQGVLMALAGLASLSGKLTGLESLKSAAEKIKEWSDKILPWLRYVSVFNVQKK